MSNPILFLHADSDSSLADFERNLCIDLSMANSALRDRKSAMVAGIAIRYRIPPLTPESSRSFDSKLVLSFQCTSYWNQLRYALILTLYQLLDPEQEKNYLCDYDTGPTFLYATPGKLQINSWVKENNHIAMALLPDNYEFVDWGSP